MHIGRPGYVGVGPVGGGVTTVPEVNAPFSVGWASHMYVYLPSVNVTTQVASSLLSIDVDWFTPGQTTSPMPHETTTAPGGTAKSFQPSGTLPLCFASAAFFVGSLRLALSVLSTAFRSRP